MPFNSVSDYFKLPEYQDRARSFYAQLAHQKEAERVQDEQLKLAQADQLIRNQKAGRDQEEFEREKALGENIMRYLNANQEEVPLTAPSAQPAIQRAPASTNPVPVMNPMAPGQEGAPSDVPLAASLAPNPMAPGQVGAPSAPQPDLMSYIKPHFDNGQLMAQSVAQPASPKTPEEQLVENSRKRDTENRRIAAMLAGVNPKAATDLLRSGGTDEARIIAAQLANERALRVAETTGKYRLGAAQLGVDAKGRQALARIAQNLSSGAGNMDVYMTDPETGQIVTENGFPVTDPEKVAEAHAKATEMAAKRLDPPEVRKALRTIDAMERLSGRQWTPDEKDETFVVFSTSGTKAPTLSSDAASKINVAEYASDAAAKLRDEIAAHPEVKFGPGVFKFNKALGEWTSSDPEASRIAQLYTTLYAGQAFAQGGKAVTGHEAKLISEQIGDPTQTNFPQKLATAHQQYVENLGKSVRDLQDRKFDVFPTMKDYVGRLANQYETMTQKYGIKPSENFAAPRAVSPSAPPTKKKLKFDANGNEVE